MLSGTTKHTAFSQETFADGAELDKHFLYHRQQLPLHSTGH